MAMNNSNKDELILDIVEKTYDKVEALQQDISEIKVQQAVHDEVVKNHEARSTASEKRLDWIENQMLMINGGLKVIIGVAAVVTFLVKILPYLSALLSK